jgi:signal transduction histidine kinase
MVERNNGEIHLESQLGQGTTFTVAFPCFDLLEDPDDTIDDEIREDIQ